MTPSLAAQIACILEATARKPGNVHRFCDFDDCTYLDFLLSSAAIASLMERVGQRGVGRTILKAVRRTREVTGTNTNLGIVLLLAPLAAVADDEAWNTGVEAVLEKLTRADAVQVYKAIRLAAPGGLGQVEAEDVGGEPTRTLREVMALAAERDNIARQYANGFRDVFEIGMTSLLDGIERGWPMEDVIVGCHLRFMAELPDTLIARKRGRPEAEESARRAQSVLEKGWPAAEGRAALDELDAWLRAVGHERNPGTTADLVAASLFVALRDGAIPRPIGASSS